MASRVGIPFVNGTHFFVDISQGGDGMSHTRTLEESGWKGICADPFPDRDRTCEAVSMPIVANDGEKVMVNDCSSRPSSMQAVLAVFRNCPQVERTGVSMDNLLKISRAPSIIDFIHLDSGGSEEQILSTFPFDKFCVRAWAVSKAQQGSTVGSFLRDRDCRIKEAPVGYFARCSCSEFEQAAAMSLADQSEEKEVKRRSLSKMARRKMRNARRQSMEPGSSMMRRMS